jgi:uncharacterized membrane protein YraQ (UPF0718 family)
MNENIKHKTAGKQFLPVIALCIVVAVVFYYSPAKGRMVAVTAWSYFLEIIAILPAVVLLMGLFEAWIPKHLIQRYLGKQSGATGILLAILFGTAPTGPLYIAFPIAAGLLKKGARPANVVIFLGAWAAAKLPQIMVEAKFLGIDFALLRFVLTVTVITVSGYIMENLVGIGKASVDGNGSVSVKTSIE